MNTQRMIGIALLVIGIIMLMIGLTASDSLADQVSKTFTGRFTDSTVWYIYGGIAMTLFGGLLVLFAGRRALN